MTFEYWLVIVLDSEEIFEACLTEEEAQAVANNLKNNASWDVTIEKVELTKEKILAFLQDSIKSDYCYLEMFGLPEDYFNLKEQEETEKEIEELAKFVEIISDMDKEN